MKFDWFDSLAIGGLATLGAGLWLIHPGVSLAVVGLVVLVFGVFGSSVREGGAQARKAGARSGRATEG